MAMRRLRDCYVPVQYLMLEDAKDICRLWGVNKMPRILSESDRGTTNDYLGERKKKRCKYSTWWSKMRTELDVEGQ